MIADPDPLAADPATGPARPIDRRFPPVAELATVSLALVVIGGILMASYAPRRPPLGPPTSIAVISAVLIASSTILLARLQRFAWDRFVLVFRWALLAYAISAGAIAFAFIRDHTRGASLALVLVMLVIYTLDVPLIIAFTVARYAAPPPEPG